jgi:hypothetical protein
MICAMLLASSAILTTLPGEAAPSWVPPELRAQYDRVMKDARDYTAILEEKSLPVRCEVCKDHAVVTVRRASLVETLDLGPIRNLTSCEVVNNTLVIHYKDEPTTKEKTRYFLYGLGTGGILALLGKIGLVLLAL